jgi:hypothetical protein
VDLLGTLSNPETGTSMHRLAYPPMQPPEQAAGIERREDRRRRYRSVQLAVDAVLEAASGPLSAAEIHAQVEGLLGGPVARSSVRNRLAGGVNTRPAAYERVARGSYRRRF